MPRRGTKSARRNNAPWDNANAPWNEANAWNGSQRPDYPVANNAAFAPGAAFAPAPAAPAPGAALAPALAPALVPAPARTIPSIEELLSQLKAIQGIVANPAHMIERLKERRALYARISDLAKSEEELIRLDIRRSTGRNNNNNNSNASLGGTRRRKSKS
jgi:hypothetical protein